MKAHFYFTSAIVTVWVQTKWKPADILLMNIWIITSTLWEVMTWNIEVTGFLKYYFGAEVGKLWHMGQSQSATWYICISPSAFLSLKGEKNQRQILQAVWKLYEIQVSLSINKTLLEHKIIHFLFYLFLFYFYYHRLGGLNNKHVSQFWGLEFQHQYPSRFGVW